MLRKANAYYIPIGGTHQSFTGQPPQRRRTKEKALKFRNYLFVRNRNLKDRKKRVSDEYSIENFQMALQSIASFALKTPVGGFSFG
ncbi:MAG: hypothetical protein ABSB81_06370 [Halobacteriota archaeon]|jgi:hypothetical protein